MDEGESVCEIGESICSYYKAVVFRKGAALVFSKKAEKIVSGNCKNQRQEENFHRSYARIGFQMKSDVIHKGNSTKAVTLFNLTSKM